MSNSLFRELNQNQNSAINSMLNVIKNSNNPNAMLIQMARNNPNIAQIINEIQNNGGDAKGLFYAKAKQLGIDPNMILNRLK